MRIGHSHECQLSIELNGWSRAVTQFDVTSQGHGRGIEHPAHLAASWDPTTTLFNVAGEGGGSSKVGFSAFWADILEIEVLLNDVFRDIGSMPCMTGLTSRASRAARDLMRAATSINRATSKRSKTWASIVVQEVIGHLESRQVRDIAWLVRHDTLVYNNVYQRW
jgi:hypothetical protein